MPPFSFLARSCCVARWAPRRHSESGLRRWPLLVSLAAGRPPCVPPSPFVSHLPSVLVLLGTLLLLLLSLSLPLPSSADRIQWAEAEQENLLKSYRAVLQTRRKDGCTALHFVSMIPPHARPSWNLRRRDDPCAAPAMICIRQQQKMSPRSSVHGRGRPPTGG
jgi:hypothetical protein